MKISSNESLSGKDFSPQPNTWFFPLIKKKGRYSKCQLHFSVDQWKAHNSLLYLTECSKHASVLIRLVLCSLHTLAWSRSLLPQILLHVFHHAILCWIFLSFFVSLQFPLLVHFLLCMPAFSRALLALASLLTSQLSYLMQYS